MAHEFTTSYLEDSIELFRYYKKLAERAMQQAPDEALFAALDKESNSIAIIVKHMAGDMRSRWVGFFYTGGGKTDPERDKGVGGGAERSGEMIGLGGRGWEAPLYA